jgi:hypothetical protein
LSFLKKAWDRIRGGQTYEKNDLRDFGISIVTTETLFARLEDISEALDKIEDDLKLLNFSKPHEAFRTLRDDIKYSDNLVRTYAFPFLRSMDNKQFLKAIWGYETIMNITEYCFTTVEGLLQKIKTTANREIEATDGGVKEVLLHIIPSLSATTLVEMLAFFSKVVTIRAQKMILAMSWSREDVTGKTMGVFQVMPQPGERIPTTISGSGEYVRKIDFGEKRVQEWQKKKYDREKQQYIEDNSQQ